MRWYLPLVLLLLVLPASAYNINYPFPGTWNWTATNATIFVNMVGGGGSGASSGSVVTAQSTWGYGGEAAEFGNTTGVHVTVGVAYPITVGAGGATALPSITGPGSPAVKHDGGDSSAFGITKHGGAGGLMGSESSANGGNGEWTNYLTTTIPFYADAGGSVTNFTGGLGGFGKGSGGGGAAGNSSDGADGYPGATYGGAGEDGLVGIWDMNGSSLNIPAYTAAPLSAGYGSVVTFTDESVLNDAANLTYRWEFGDGSVSTTVGTVTHVYSTYGVFSTNLTITSDLSTEYLNKSDYITITNVPITAWYTQKLVRLKIVDAFGNDLPGANISISYVSNTLPSKDVTWLTSAFGISQAVANQMIAGDLAMQGWSDSDGSSVFTMFPAIQYGITISNVTTGLSKYITLYPEDTDYVIYCPLPSQAEPTSRITHLYNASLYVTEPDADHIMWNFIYMDTSGYTTNVKWNVTCLNNGTVVYESPGWGPGMGYATGPLIDNFTFHSEPKGYEYQAMFDATRNVP